MGLVYVATNLHNEKKYVGLTTQTLQHRRYRHEWNAGRGSSYPFHRALAIYGKESFSWQVLATADAAELPDLERQYVSLHGSFGKGGYNCTSGGEKQKTYSEETRAKMRAAHKGRVAGAKHPLYGKHHSEATKAAISRAKVGVTCSLEQRANLSARLKGREVTEATRQKISAGHKGKKKGGRLIYCPELSNCWNSVREASQALGITKPCIFRVLRGERKHTDGLTFHYKEVPINDGMQEAVTT